jgi:enolase
MLDPAASEFFEDGSYVFRKSDQRRLSSDLMISLWQDWLWQYPEIWSLEDCLAEEDRGGW